MKILLEYTDETHSLTMEEIKTKLKLYDISAERKSLYNDIESLRLYGLDIIGTKEDRTYSYHIGNRQFELAELKLLVDSVQSAKFITEKKSNDLIKNLALSIISLKIYKYLVALNTFYRNRMEKDYNVLIKTKINEGILQKELQNLKVCMEEEYQLLTKPL